MTTLFKFFTYILFAGSLILGGCSAEDGQDGIAGRDGADGKDGTPGINGTDGTGGGAGGIDLGWDLFDPGTREAEFQSIGPSVQFANITTEELETLAIFAFVRSPNNTDLKFALPTTLLFGDDAIPYDISVGGIDGNSIFILIEKSDGTPIPVDAVIPQLEFKIILVPSQVPSGSIDFEKFLD